MVDPSTAFVVGWPIEHSRSPLIHRHWLKEHGIQGDYVKEACRPEDFAAFLQQVKATGCPGGNVTVPHKEAAAKLVDHLHGAAKVLGAVNTIWNENALLHGMNSDGYGFLANLDQSSPGWDKTENKKRGALVLGAGGASRAIIHSLKERGFQTITIANRTLDRAHTLAQHFGEPCHSCGIDDLPETAWDSGIIVNTTSIGMGDGKIPLNLTPFRQESVVCDIVYSPLETPLLKQAKQLGMTTVDGLGMLLHQAVPGFEKWFGIRPKVTPELRNILLNDLGELG